MLYGCKTVKNYWKAGGGGKNNVASNHWQKHKCRNMLGERAGCGHDQHLGIKRSAETLELVTAAIPCGCALGLDSRRQTGALVILCGEVDICFWLLSTEMSNPLC